MNTPFMRLKPFTASALALLLLGSLPLRAQDSDSDQQHHSFFHRLGNSLFRGTRKLEKSDTAPGVPSAPSEAPVAPPVKTTKRETTASQRRSSSSSESTSRSEADAPKPKPRRSVERDEQPEAKPVSTAKTTAPKPDAPSDKGAPTAASTSASPNPQDVRSSSPGDKPAEYPLGTQGHTSGFVKSPYPPHNELDARGMISGTLARDPTTGKIFRVP